MTVSTTVSWSRYGYVLSTGLFAVSVLAQVYIAGMAAFVDPANWALHRSVVHVVELFLLPMLVFAFLGRLSGSLKLVPVGLFLLVGLQFATASLSGTLFAAENRDGRAQREVEAEAVAYVVGRYFGLDSSNSAFYLAAWKRDEPATVRERLTRISEVSAKIIETCNRASETPIDTG